jgi:hypothetical protein
VGFRPYSYATKGLFLPHGAWGQNPTRSTYPTGGRTPVSERQPGPTSPAFGDRSANLARLDPESVAAIARYVVALLRDGDEPGGLIDAAEVARRRGVSRD